MLSISPLPYKYTYIPSRTPPFTDSKCPSPQWNTTQPYKRMSFCHLWQHGWAWRASCWWHKFDKERLTLYGITYTWNLWKHNQLVNITKKKPTHRERKISDYQRGEEGRGNTGVGSERDKTTRCKIGSGMHCTTQGMEPTFCSNCKWKVTFKIIRLKKISFWIVGGLGMDMYTVLWLKRRADRDHTEFCSMLCGGLDGRGVGGRMDTCVCMAESLCCSPETVTTLLTGYIPIQNNKLKKKIPSL